MTVKLGNIAQGHKVTKMPETNSVFFLDYDAITYAVDAVNCRP